MLVQDAVNINMRLQQNQDSCTELAAEYDRLDNDVKQLSAGIFGYPKDKAWRRAIQACKDFFEKNPDADLQVVFAVLDDGILTLGQKTLAEIAPEYEQGTNE